MIIVDKYNKIVSLDKETIGSAIKTIQSIFGDNWRDVLIVNDVHIKVDQRNVTYDTFDPSHNLIIGIN